MIRLRLFGAGALVAGALYLFITTALNDFCQLLLLVSLLTGSGLGAWLISAGSDSLLLWHLSYMLLDVSALCVM